MSLNDGDGISIQTTVLSCIRKETGHVGEISLTDVAGDVDGWDSIAHIRIMYRIEMTLGIDVDITETYSAETIGNLVDMVRKICSGG